ncbi:nucleoside hydrolase [Vagococcus entomophilus]|uniref:Nucleoside hydrolase n=1 Tax=Vagococcus entomophilus TaxID=1160095 RepID=A0A430AHW3_9ENTE|nr:nucleoside hydrolase [Vagococcus entomophilus]RSU07699.1 nucleoside hydrolase [Vagococcus entomophilus]
MNVKKKVIIDCDPGIDDCLALLLALKSPELDILGITIVCGNVPTELGAKNALKVLKRENRLDIPVYLGASKPLKRTYISAQDTHGQDGLGESFLPDVQDIAPQTTSAVDFLNETFSNQKHVSIIALGPLTNIAQALQENPNAWNNIEDFVSMGGTFKSHGNCSPVAEYNYWCDPDAACYVFEHLAVPVKMVGLDVTRKIVLTPNILEYMQQLDPETGGFIAKITRFYFDFHWTHEQVIGCVINDPLAVAYFLCPDLSSGFPAYTTVATNGVAIGQTIVDEKNIWNKKTNSLILTKVDSFLFMEMFLNRVMNAQTQNTQTVLKQIMNGEFDE